MIIKLPLATQILAKLLELYTVRVFGQVLPKDNLVKVISDLKLIQQNGSKDDNLAAECGGYAINANVLMDMFNRANGRSRSLKPLPTEEIEHQLSKDVVLTEVEQLRLAMIAFSAIRFRCADGSESTIKRPQ